MSVIAVGVLPLLAFGVLGPLIAGVYLAIKLNRRAD
jgi:hypothetical protein